MFNWFKKKSVPLQAAKEVEEKVDSGFPPLPKNHYFRVRKRESGNTQKWPLYVEVVKKENGEERFVDLKVSEANPESIAEAMHNLSEEIFSNAKKEAEISKYCGDYYP